MTEALLLSVDEARARIESGEPLLVSAEQQVLEQLPRGNWIGGTSPYFLTPAGGVTNRESVFVQTMPPGNDGVRFANLDANALPQIAERVEGREYIFVIIPGLSQILMTYAADSMSYPKLMNQPVIGWVSGVYLGEGGNEKPLVVDGRSGEFFDDRVVVAYVRLEANIRAELGILNIFEQGDGDVIQFREDGFEFSSVLINGEEKNFADYIDEKVIDVKLPLVADYSGTMVNASVKNVDRQQRTVELYAPVFSDFEYKVAAVVPDYRQALKRSVSEHLKDSPAISCTCILNYLYGELEGRSIGSFTGPVTFGEIGYVLLNQTITYLSLKEDR